VCILNLSEHMDYTRGKKMHAGFWRGNLKQRDHLEDIGVHMTIILKCVLNK